MVAVAAFSTRVRKLLEIARWLRGDAGAPVAQVSNGATKLVCLASRPNVGPEGTNRAMLGAHPKNTSEGAGKWP